MVDPAFLLPRLFLGLGTGVCIGLTGVGGGVLVVPALALLGLSPPSAVATASVYVVLTKVWAGVHHLRRGNVHGAAVGLFLAGGVPAAAVAAAVVGSRAGSPAFQSGLGWAVGALIAGSGLALWLAPRGAREAGASSAAKPAGSAALARSQQNSPGRRLRGVCLGALSGAAIGATSVGGGVILIPCILISFPLTARQAVGSSVLIGLTLSGTAGIIYLASMGRNPDLPLLDAATALYMVLGSLAGVGLGVRWNAALSEAWLRRLVLAMTACAACGMFWSVWP